MRGCGRMKFIDGLVKKYILKSFFDIELSNVERDIALESIECKYGKK